MARELFRVVGRLKTFKHRTLLKKLCIENDGLTLTDFSLYGVGGLVVNYKTWFARKYGFDVHDAKQSLFDMITEKDGFVLGVGAKADIEEILIVLRLTHH